MQHSTYGEESTKRFYTPCMAYGCLIEADAWQLEWQLRQDNPGIVIRVTHVTEAAVWIVTIYPSFLEVVDHAKRTLLTERGSLPAS